MSYLIKRWFYFPAMSLACVLLVGCMAVEMPALSAYVPQRWHSVEPDTRPLPSVDLHGWWKHLNDPVLNGLVNEALANNLDLEQATLRLRSEQLLAGSWRGAYLPSLEGNAHTLQDVAATDSYFHAGINMSWELGLFGALESARLKSQANVEHAQAHRQGALVALVAEVVRSYLDLGVARQQLQLLTQLQGLDHEAYRLAQVREQNHLGSQEEVEQARVRELHTQAKMAQMQEMAERAGRALALLLGRAEPAAEWAQINATPVLPDFAVSALPADLLRTRPDVQAAEAGVMEAAAELGTARSALYPRLSLGGSLLYSYNITRNVRTSTDSVPSLGPVIDIPLWDWGQRRARVDADQKMLDAALLGYRKSVLVGVSETEGALAALARQKERIEALAEARQIQQARVQRESSLLATGLASDYEALAARRELLQADAQLGVAQGARLLAFVALYKALGGAPVAVSSEPRP